MCALRKIRIFMGAMLIAPGLAISADAGPAAIDMPPPAAMSTDVPMPSLASAWPMHGLPVPGVTPYYPMPQPVMVWSVFPGHPARMVMPPMMPVPFVWVLVPIPAMAPEPAVADPLGLTETPAIGAPLPDAAPSAAIMEAATPAPVPAGTRTVPPVAEGTHAANAAVTDWPPAAAKPDPSPAAVAPEPVAALAAAPVSVKLVDYGPVAPTPVVDLLALQQVTRAGFRKSTRSTSRPAQKPAVGTQPEARPAAAAQPVKKRLCWTKGVVAPCR